MIALRIISLVLNHMLLLSGICIATRDVLLWQWRWIDFSIAVGAWLILGLGITVGFHRYLTHKTLEFRGCAGNWIVRPAILLAGSCAFQGSALWWRDAHTKHHHHSDKSGDPHSPNSWSKFIAVQLALWVPFEKAGSHFDQERKGDPFVCFISKPLLYPILGPLLGILIAWLIGGLSGIVWFLAGTFVIWHATQSVNSVSHLGWLREKRHWQWLFFILCLGKMSRHKSSVDNSINVPWLSVLTHGESWHANHHRAQKSARFARYWYQPDLGWYVIVILQRLRLVQNVRVSPVR